MSGQEGKIKIKIDAEGVATLDTVDQKLGKIEKSTGSLGKALSDLTSNQLQAAIHGTVEWVRSIPEGAAAAERHEAALRSLGGAYAEVSQATRGGVTAEQALQVQQRLTQSGLALSGTQLAAVTQRAREYARVTGGDVNQALEQLTEGLRGGSAEALRAYGINVREGQVRTDAFRQAMGQLEGQLRSTTPAAQSLAETNAELSRTMTETNQQLQAMAAQELGLRDFFGDMTTWLREATRGQMSWTEAISGTVREMVGLRANATASTEGTRSRGNDFVAQYNQRIDRLRQSGMDVSGYPLAGHLAAAASDEQYRQALENLDIDIQQQERNRQRYAHLGGDPMARSPGARQGRVNQILREARAGEAERAALSSAQRELAESERQRALSDQARRERASRGGGGSPDFALGGARFAYQQAVQSAGLAGAAGALGVTPGPMGADLESQRLEAARRAATDTGARSGEQESARLSRLTGAMREYLQILGERQERERAVTESVRAGEQADVDAEKALRQRWQEGLRAALSERTEQLSVVRERIDLAHQEATAQGRASQADQQRTRELTGLRDALANLLRDTDERIRLAHIERASQEHLNTLLQQRLGLQRSQIQVNAELRASEEQRTASTRAFRDEMVGALGQTADAFGAATAAAIEGTDSFDVALGKMLRSVMVNLAKQSVVEVLKNLGMAAYNAAIGNIPSATNHGIAAGLWGAVGVAAGGLAVATRPAAPAPQLNSGAPRAASVPGAGARESTGGGNLQLSIQVNGALFNEGVEESIVRGIDRAATRGLIPRHWQGRGAGS